MIDGQDTIAVQNTKEYKAWQIDQDDLVCKKKGWEMSHFSEFLKVQRWAINIKKDHVLKTNQRGTLLMWILWCLDCVLVTCSPAQYFKKLMNRTLKNDADKGSWQDSWEMISIKWMYYKEKQEKLWIGIFLPCDSALSLRGT